MAAGLAAVAAQSCPAHALLVRGCAGRRMLKPNTMDLSTLKAFVNEVGILAESRQAAHHGSDPVGRSLLSTAPM